MRSFLASKLKRQPEGAGAAGAAGAMRDEDIIINGNFDSGLEGWRASYGCKVSLCDPNALQGIQPRGGEFVAVVSGRTQGWQGIEQDISERVKPGIKYEVLAFVSVAGVSEADVLATAKLEKKDSDTKYMQLGRARASRGTWTRIQGPLLLNESFDKVLVYLEGPPAGIDILVDSVSITTQSSGIVPGKQDCSDVPDTSPSDSVIKNACFSRGLQGWSARSCTLTLDDPHVSPCTGYHFAIASNRTQTWHGIEQDVTGRLSANIMYDVRATVRIRGGLSRAEVLATLYIRKSNMQEQYMTIGRTTASAESWSSLQGCFTIHSMPKRAVIFLEGPAPGVDILVDSFSVCPAKKPEPSPPPSFQNPMFGINIVENSDLHKGLSSWFSMGSCSLRVATGAPKILPPSAKLSLEFHPEFSGNFIVATNRKFGWEGPAQKLTERIQLFLPYQVCAWVRIGGSSQYLARVNVALSVDGQWMSGGEVEASSSSWTEVAGSFRLEKKPSEVMVYVQGPDAGLDIMVANLRIFSVNRSDQYAALKKQADQVRKRDVVLRIKSDNPLRLQVKQISSSFALGACINRINLENAKYVDYFLKTFNYTVFENEMKWGWTEPEQGKLNFREADELCKFCADHKLPVRGHCVFWEVEHCVQGWLKKLSKEKLQAAVESRIEKLVSRYRGKFQHYDVNNEMLHGDFYKSRLGDEVHANMFKQIHRLDPSARLFVNDYHVEDGREANSSARRYVQQIDSLIAQGAPVGGIGVQGHVDVPVGPILRGSLDELAMLGLPIWLTEVDVSSSNEHVRADDLEAVLREAFAHPAVEGVVLWGFWQGCCRSDGHLVEVDGTLNEAGKRLEALRGEWRTELSGSTDKEGKFAFRGYCGSYKALVEKSGGQKVEVSFDVSQDTNTIELRL
ncbi:uncharacterized protein LOC9637546 [Selaginella moellendorffii]|uniref:uncharacterized protein LOC9637546 n=1 Tax=Selaginella moellendorffii TaxID=88036 RepID=UPI000D1CC776|nr:uncharacterized protein LOC9637546 [Selaginella moellendorffii]|eukprot:XP_024517945.1 uncharacterized protein LOC9637546 [Selaginella moellendorffii]